MTHDDLVARVVRWLRNSRDCSVVLTAATIFTTERPDAIGWNSNGFSVLVECKVSRADFFADAKKPFRVHPEHGCGWRRYYLTPPGLVAAGEVDHRWGLLECREKIIRVRREAPAHDKRHLGEEVCLLLAAIRRGDRGFVPVELDAGVLPDVGL